MSAGDKLIERFSKLPKDFTFAVKETALKEVYNNLLNNKLI
jgi:hypothetical protein